MYQVEGEENYDEKASNTIANVEAIIPDKNDEYSKNFESQLEKEAVDKTLLRSRSLDDDISDNDYNDEGLSDHQDELINNVVLRRKSGSTAIKRRHEILKYYLFLSIIFLFFLYTLEQED